MEQVDDAETRALLERNRGAAGAHGGDRKSEAYQADNVSLKDYGTSASYLARVLVELREAEDRARDLRIRAQEVSDRVRRLREQARGDSTR